MSKTTQKKDKTIDKALQEVFAGCDPTTREVIGNAFDAVIKRAAEVGAEVGAKAVIDAVENERRKYRSERYRKQYANTRLLLQHYRSLNSHYANAVWQDDEDDPDEFLDIMELMSGRGYSDVMFVDSIRKSSEKTRIIMRHVNKMLDEYRKMCENSKHPDDMRHWRVIKALYLSPNMISADDVAEMVHINKRTVYKDVDAAVDDLTLLFFGVEAIEKLGE